MIKELFIGKPVHWFLVMLLVPAGYTGGSYVFHVTNFVSWASLLFITTFMLIIALWLSSSSQDRITRDPISDESETGLREYAD